MVVPRVLVAFHACVDHPGEVAAELAGYLRRAGVEVALHRAASAPDPSPYAAVVLGDGRHLGAASPEIVDYVSRHVRALNARPCGLFEVTAAGDAATATTRPAVPVAVTDTLHGPATFRPRLTARFATTLAPSLERWTHRPHLPGHEPTARRRPLRPEPHPDDPAAVEHFARRLLGLLVAGRVG
jgi:menaquinone-dependent protoporphyrinogen IX oxidase